VKRNTTRGRKHGHATALTNSHAELHTTVRQTAPAKTKTPPPQPAAQKQNKKTIKNLKKNAPPTPEQPKERGRKEKNAHNEVAGETRIRQVERGREKREEGRKRTRRITHEQTTEQL